MSTKPCKVTTSISKYLQCETHKIVLQNPSIKSEQDFRAEHGQEQWKSQTVEARAEALTGHADLDQAFNFFENERKGMLELHNRNTAQATYIRRVENLIALCIRIAAIADHDASLFSPKLRELINQFNREQAEMADDLAEALKL